MKFIFITGGVASSIGKGVVTSSISALLCEDGYKIKIKKLDPYLNVDPGTMNPLQHGEVFVTEDGGESDLDLGHYERFAQIKTSKNDNITSGKIYREVINRERAGGYQGQTVQIVPHVTNMIKDYISNNDNKYDFTICEIGGTVGDIEGQPFLEAIRQLSYDIGRENCFFIHLTLVPYIDASDEFKTKPTQHSVKMLQSYGIMPDMIFCRSKNPLPQNEKKKIALFCNVKEKHVIDANDVINIYQVPFLYRQNGVDALILKHFKIQSDRLIDDENFNWFQLNQKIDNLKNQITIAIVGKYVESKDAYKSLMESLSHAGISLNIKVNIKFINAKKIINEDQFKQEIDGCSAMVIGGGFGYDGVEGKVVAIKYARENNIPLLGICFGMQLATVEFARNILNISNANSTEFGDLENITPIVGFMEQWQSVDGTINKRTRNDDFGGTLRLGLYPTAIKKNTLASKIYQDEVIYERHRHRYEVNFNFIDKFAEFGGVFSGLSPDGKLPEIFEITEYKHNGKIKKLDFFITVQYHPEFNSTPFHPNKLFIALVEAGVKKG